MTFDPHADLGPYLDADPELDRLHRDYEAESAEMERLIAAEDVKQYTRQLVREIRAHARFVNRLVELHPDDRYVRDVALTFAHIVEWGEAVVASPDEREETT